MCVVSLDEDRTCRWWARGSMRRCSRLPRTLSANPMQEGEVQSYPASSPRLHLTDADPPASSPRAPRGLFGARAESSAEIKSDKTVGRSSKYG